MWGHPHCKIMKSPTGVITLKLNKTGQKQAFLSNVRWSGVSFYRLFVLESPPIFLHHLLVDPLNYSSACYRQNDWNKSGITFRNLRHSHQSILHWPVFTGDMKWSKIWGLSKNSSLEGSKFKLHTLAGVTSSVSWSSNMNLPNKKKSL